MDKSNEGARRIKRGARGGAGIEVSCDSCGIRAHMALVDGWEDHLRNRGWLIDGQARWNDGHPRHTMDIFDSDERFCPTCAYWEYEERWRAANQQARAGRPGVTIP